MRNIFAITLFVFTGLGFLIGDSVGFPIIGSIFGFLFLPSVIGLAVIITAMIINSFSKIFNL